MAVNNLLMLLDSQTYCFFVKNEETKKGNGESTGQEEHENLTLPTTTTPTTTGPLRTEEAADKTSLCVTYLTKPFSSAEVYISCVSSKINQKTLPGTHINTLTHINNINKFNCTDFTFFSKSPFVFSFKHHI